MKHLYSTAVTAAFLAFSVATAVADVTKKDQDFFTKAAGGGMYEVDAGKLAQTKGQSDGVKSYGSMLVKDHGAANDELKALASKKGATLPSAIPADKQKKLEKLSKEKNFDKEFVEEVGLDDHRVDIALFEKTSKDADDADVKAFAAKTLPTLKAHREHAEGLKKSQKN
jgi:putative membrane protein